MGVAVATGAGDGVGVVANCRRNGSLAVSDCSCIRLDTTSAGNGAERSPRTARFRLSGILSWSSWNTLA
jgi:hypothetical protein